MTPTHSTNWTTANAYTAASTARLKDFRGNDVIVYLYRDGFAIAFYQPGGPRLPERYEKMDAGELARVLNDYGVKAAEGEKK